MAVKYSDVTTSDMDEYTQWQASKRRTTGSQWNVEVSNQPKPEVSIDDVIASLNADSHWDEMMKERELGE